MADKKISELTEVTTPTDADLLPVVDDADITTKKLTWANLKATLKTYFDTLYATLSGQTTGWISLGAATYEGADAPTYTISFASDMTGILSEGMKIKLTDSTVKFFFVTGVGAFSAGKTIITLFGGSNAFGETPYTLSGGAISAPCYSLQAAPFGFPLEENLWCVGGVDNTPSSADPTNAWSNLFSQVMTFPIGRWKLKAGMQLFWNQNLNGGDQGNIGVCLSTANNSMSNEILSAAYNFQPSANGVMRSGTRLCFDGAVKITTKTVYYFNYKDETNTISTLYKNTVLSVPSVWKAVISYL